MEENKHIISVKNWHVVLAFMLWVVQAIWSYATLRAQSDENTRRVNKLEETNVHDRFQEFQQDIQRRLQRIEDKIDTERNLRSLK